MKKGICGFCNKKFTLTKDNFLRKHGHNNEPRNLGCGQRISDFCKGSGTKPIVKTTKWLYSYYGYDVEKNLTTQNYEVKKNNVLILIFQNEMEAKIYIENLQKECA
jgi:hypothetical protein